MTTTPVRLKGAPHDAALVMSMRQGDERSLEVIYRRHGGAVYGVARRVLASDHQAEEIVQEVFLRLWREPDRFDPRRGALRTFLAREAQSRSIERVRSEAARGRREERREREEPMESYDLEREAWQLARNERLKDALLNLTEGEREAIYLAYFGGQTYREVAVTLGLAEGTVKSRIRLGLRKLAVALGERGIEDGR